MTLLTILIYVFYLYLCLGFLFALWFTMVGVNKLDAGMVHAPWGVRLLLIPGSTLLWVVLAKKLIDLQ